MMEAVEALLSRSRALGADRSVTNHAGGNTSCKVRARDPVNGQEVDLLWVKGSGGDLATLERHGLAALVLERVRAIAEEDDDGAFALLDHCRFGPGGAPPSIDTPLHALLPPAHCDHVHPDAVIALAAARDGEQLVKECYGDTVAWVPWRRPGFGLARQMAAVYSASLRGIVMGGHGLFSWGETSDQCRENTIALVQQAEDFLARRGRADPFGPVVRTPSSDRGAAAVIGPRIRGLCSTDRRVVGHLRDDPVVLDFLSRDEAPRLAAMGTSCPDHFLRTRVRPLWVDGIGAAPEAHAAYRAAYAEYYGRHADADSPPMRGADPTVVLVPGVGMWTFGADAASARITGEYFVNAIEVMRGAESLTAYEPIADADKFAIEYWHLEQAKIERQPPPPVLAGRVAVVTGAASGIGRAIAARLAAEGAAVVGVDITEGADIRADVSDEGAVDDAMTEACLRFGGVDLVVNCAGLSLSRPLLDTTVEDWDRQHAVMARGSFLVSRAAARVMIEQGLGGDIVYVVSKNAVVASPDNVAYAAAKADQAQQVRVLAAELGRHAMRVNGVNPDAVVRGSGIFAGGWGADRAAAHGVSEDDLPRFYAERTLLKKEVTAAHVAAAVFALVGGDLPVTTGTIIPVDGGVPAAFLR